MITHNGKQVTLAMRNRKAINLIARNGKAMFGEYGDVAYTAIDKAAKAVILAEYGSVVWSDVRDYAKAHPAIVPFINQDPHLAASISTNSNKERWLVGDGKAYILTNIYPKTNTWFDISLKTTDNDNNTCGILSGSTRGNDAGLELYFWDKKWTIISNGSHNTGVTANTNTKYRVVRGITDYEIYEEGVSVKSGTIAQPTYESNSPICLYCLNRGNTKSYNGKPWIEQAIIGQDTEQVANLVPHLTADGQCGMLDLVTYTFHPNANTKGAFTIAITDKE